MRLARIFSAVLLLGASAVWASDKLPVANNTYGTAALTWVTLTPWDFHPIDSLTTYGYVGNPTSIYRTSTGGGGFFEAPLRLPEGAVVSVIELAGCDTNATWDLYVSFDVIPKTGFGTSVGSANTTGSTGCQDVSNSTAPFTFTVNNDTASYVVDAHFPVSDVSLLLNSVRVGYKLQVSPAPATATFNDVPTTHLFYQYIEALAAAGITSGCGGGNFCPDAAVTRGQMAVFLAKALGLHWTP
jgi:hypothetical protein